MTKAAIGIGSSLGEREATVRAALAELAALPATRLLAVSKLHETTPVGGVAKNPFINACAVLETELSPHELLGHLKCIEDQHGRTRQVRWADRTLDLDLLFYGDLVLDDPTCTLPHPEMHRRVFVLLPLAEIAPDWLHPIFRKTISILKEEMKD